MNKVGNKKVATLCVLKNKNRFLLLKRYNEPNKDKYVPSNIMCNNAYQDSGCLCLTKEQAGFLSNRGGNGTNL